MLLQTVLVFDIIFLCFRNIFWLKFNFIVRRVRVCRVAQFVHNAGIIARVASVSYLARHFLNQQC